MRAPTLAPVLAFASLVSACGSGGTAEDTTGCTQVVAAPTGNPDTDHAAIQTALETAKSGSTVCLRSGTYKSQQEISLSTDEVTVRSVAGGRAVIDFAGQKAGANGVTVIAGGFTIADLDVKNTAGDAIKVTQGDGVTFRNVGVTWDAGRNTSNGAYGVYPVQCSRVLIDGCKVSYAADAGIYVGQSSRIIVRNSEAFGNVAGIEIENSSDAEVYGNYTHDNTGGILVFNLPALMVHGGSRTSVHDNRVIENNGLNFAARSGVVSTVPLGTGMLVMAENGGEIWKNTITGNDSAGIALISYFIIMRDDYKMDPLYDPYPEGNYIHDNRMTGNGERPDGLAFMLALGAGRKTVPELVWDGFVDSKKDNSSGALTNCFKDNGDADYVNLGLDEMGNPHPSEDIKPVTCTHPSLPPVTL